MKYKKAMKKPKFFLMIPAIFFCSLIGCDDECATEPDPAPTQTQTEEHCFGLYSDSQNEPCCHLNEDCKIGVYRGGEAAIEIEETSGTYCEPNHSMKTVLNVPFPNGWAGWFIQCGLFDTPDTIDMNEYRNGYLCFCFRSTIEFGIGIRSHNIYEGNEKSWILISDYLEPKDEWQELCIPIIDFLEKDDELRLSEMKVLFNVFSNSETGGTVGETEFWIDYVRWCKELPAFTDMPSRPILQQRKIKKLDSDDRLFKGNKSVPSRVITKEGK